MPVSWYTYLNQYKVEDKFRFKFYVLDGPSGLGKTEAVRLQYPIGALLELNCQNTDSPNWRLFDRDQHVAILLDEATPQLCINFKKEIQADNTLCVEGTSGTNMYAFTCWFYRVQFIVACNRWNWDLWYLDPEDYDWMTQNSIVETVDEHTFKVRSQ